jgi:hypothetical protein
MKLQGQVTSPLTYRFSLRKIGAVELESYEAPTGQKVIFAEPEIDKTGVALCGGRYCLTCKILAECGARVLFKS